MNEQQIKIADSALRYLAENNYRVDGARLKSYLRQQYGHQAMLDVNVVLESLINDYGFITPMGDFLRLTKEGCVYAKKGMADYKTKLSYKEKISMSKDILAIISSICSILSFLLGYLVCELT